MVKEPYFMHANMFLKRKMMYGSWTADIAIIIHQKKKFFFRWHFLQFLELGFHFLGDHTKATKVLLTVCFVKLIN